MIKINVEQVAGFIREVAQEEVLPRWRNLAEGDISEKNGPDDVVTIADKESEKALSRRLLAAYPQSMIVGEEGAAADESIMERLSGDQPVWIIDPIDGTMAFSKGRPYFDIMLALVQNGEILAGWIYAPVDDDFYMGEKGGGVMRQSVGQPAQKLPPVYMPENIESMTGIMGKKFFTDEEHQTLKNRCGVFKNMINTLCAGHDYARLLRGEAHFSVYNKCMPWDHVPGLALVSELGFAFSRHDRSPYMPWHTSGGILVTPKSAAQDKIRTALGF
jgi:fructose-1,6-bisphosphatase/inositol monophosphatase family enzyme